MAGVMLRRRRRRPRLAVEAGGRGRGGWRLEAEAGVGWRLRPGWRLMSEAEAEAGAGRLAPGVDVMSARPGVPAEAGGRRLMAWRRTYWRRQRCHTGVKAWRPGVRRQST
jgi:hypothetical protein